MKIISKVGLVAVLAVIVAAFAIPAVASASNWKDKGVELTETRNIPMSGKFSFTGSLGGVSCSTVNANVKLEPGESGQITDFTPVLSSCHGTGGLSGCTVSGPTIQWLPWGIDIDFFLPQITITGGIGITWHFSGFFCPATISLTSTGTRMPVLTPDNGSAIHSLTIGGELEANVGGAVTASGELKPTNASDSGTYGL
jgi:hypothetical protein